VPAARDLDPGASSAHFFGAEVRRAREAAGMTLADLGAVVPRDASTVSRVESGLLNPTERFSHACDESFPQMGGWFTRFYNDSRRWDGPYPRWFADWVDAEGRATVVRWWEPLLVPGLLQTPEYARALFNAWQTTGTDDEVENLVTARIDRQRIFDRPKPPSLWALLDEGVLRRSIGGAKVMHDQLAHLAELAERPTKGFMWSRPRSARISACSVRSLSQASPMTRRVPSTSSRPTRARRLRIRPRWLA
jgi:hypothetical protein